MRRVLPGRRRSFGSGLTEKDVVVLVRTGERDTRAASVKRFADRIRILECELVAVARGERRERDGDRSSEPQFVLPERHSLTLGIVVLEMREGLWPCHLQIFVPESPSKRFR